MSSTFVVMKTFFSLLLAQTAAMSLKAHNEAKGAAATLSFLDRKGATVGLHGKPPKIGNKLKTDKFKKEEEKSGTSGRLQCGITEQVNAQTDKYEDCPADCPFFAQNRQDSQHCTFLCVPGDQCGKWNANKPIPDSIKNSKTCRGPKVAFCREPHLDGTDTCKVCQTGFSLHAGDKQCYFEYWNTIISVTVILCVAFTVIIVWFVDLCCRRSVNDESVVRAEAWRSRSKLLDRETGRTNRLSTNLCTKEIGGPGLLLHFRFQAFFIVWPLFVGMVWTILAFFHNELFILGTRKFGTPRHNCILVAWGFETQQRLMWTKVLFLAIVYVGSFVSFLLFSVSQQRKYDFMRATQKTMKDFVLEITGLPEIPGHYVGLEAHIKATLEKALPAKCVACSLCWNFTDQQDDVFDACNRDLNWREAEYRLQKSLKRKPTKAEVKKELEEEYQLTQGAEEDKPGWMPLQMYNYERDLICPLEDLAKRQTEEERAAEVKELLNGLVTSSHAFAVFNTSEDRDLAWEHVKANGAVEFDAESKYKCGVVNLTLAPVLQEAVNVNWHNFGDNDPWAMVKRFFKGFFTVYLPALAIWFFVFYVPYAISIYNFNYDNGAELPGYYGFAFTIIVCGGNATMYFVCDLCCDIIGFRYKCTKQVAYMLMYLAACMVNVFLDMYVTYQVAWKIMTGLDFRTYHGDRLTDIKPFTEQFETYAMQRSLGENTYSYAWPSTFLLGFVIEPFVTIMIPYYLGKIIVRTHREVRGVCAETYMMAFELDLGRYSDILLNVFLGIIIFWFPGGYIWTLFFFMCFSHCFIYVFDHWKIIQVIPYINLVSDRLDWWAQVIMCGLCGMILSCLVFKGNCESYMGYCMQDIELIAICTVAGTAHFIVHFLLLLYLVPRFGLQLENKHANVSYEQIAKTESRTWFSANPAHCLRSKYIHEDKTPCLLAVFGKEHLLQVNKDIGCYFETVEAEAETFEITKSVSNLFKGSD